MIEIEKKYKLTEEEYNLLCKYFYESEEFDNVDSYTERNIILSKNDFSKDEVLRLRIFKNDGFNRPSILTHKKPITNLNGIKKMQELNVTVDNSITMMEILRALNYLPSLIYIKNRIDWYLSHKELTISLDKLSFGYYIEVEGEEEQILNFEDELKILDLKSRVELRSYPTLTEEYGEVIND